MSAPVTISLDHWTAAGLSYKQYEHSKQRGKLQTTNRASYKAPVQIILDSIEYEPHKEAIIKTFPELKADKRTFTFWDDIHPDPNALTFYSNYVLDDGRNLPQDKVRQYTANAEVMNGVHSILQDMIEARAKVGARVTGFWEKAAKHVEMVRQETGHSLPGKPRPLQRKYKQYQQEGYKALISGKFCNGNSRKVTDELERLILSLYTMPNKPFTTDVLTLYGQFIAGELTVADRKTGEILNPGDYMRNGQPIDISSSTVWNYLNAPHNRALVDKRRSGGFAFNSAHRPHHHRTAPTYAFSKISMDDRDLPRKLKGGDRVKAYYAYDVTSGCVIGRSYSRNKDTALFQDCLKDMFRLIDTQGLPMPMEVEVEHHLVSQFADHLAVMFPFVRFCNPGNSQEKRAEHLNRAKKYSTEKKTQTGIGRWWAKHEAYRVDRDKVNDEFVEKDYSFERLVADDIAACNDFNNSLHPNQSRFPGKTRWEVLLNNLNPAAPSLSKAIVYKAIGQATETTIRRNQYVTVQYNEYILPDPSLISRLESNNYKVTAYYLPDTDGVISEVFLYQGETFLTRAEPIQRYNEARAEQTDADRQAYADQAAYVARFDKQIKEGTKKLIPVAVVPSATGEQQVEIVPPPARRSRPDAEELLANYDEDYYRRKAIDDI